jgi:hypothetical protein
MIYCSAASVDGFFSLLICPQEEKGNIPIAFFKVSMIPPDQKDPRSRWAFQLARSHPPSLFLSLSLSFTVADYPPDGSAGTERTDSESDSSPVRCSQRKGVQRVGQHPPPDFPAVAQPSHSLTSPYGVFPFRRPLTRTCLVSHSCFSSVFQLLNVYKPAVRNYVPVSLDVIGDHEFDRAPCSVRLLL